MDYAFGNYEFILLARYDLFIIRQYLTPPLPQNKNEKSISALVAIAKRNSCISGNLKSSKTNFHKS